MAKYIRRYPEYILLAVFCLLLGGLVSAKIINSQEKRIAILNTEILNENLKFSFSGDVEEIGNQVERLGDAVDQMGGQFEEIGEQIYKMLPFLEEKIIIKNNCLLYSKDYQIKDITNKVIDKINTK